MSTYYGKGRKKYTLDKLIRSGGEGIVYEIQNQNSLVAKIYLEKNFSPTVEYPNPRQHLQEKIITMLDQPVNPYINGVLSVAWPQDILFDQKGYFVGYTMPKVNSKYHIFAASRERERIDLFPHYTWKVSVAIAYNLVVSIKAVYKANAIIGDLNPNNIMINEKGQVTLIDTDSFNITNKNTGKIYKCNVGVTEVLPPELQGKNLAKSTSVFTEKTDSFALAIHIFNLLMNNCHPFGCIGMNTPKVSLSTNAVANNIVKGICPYTSDGSGIKSPDAPDIMMLPKEIRDLFDRTFSYNLTSAVKSKTISNRPTTTEWQNALFRLHENKMTICFANSSHVYPVTYARCPWCAIKSKKSLNTNTNSNVPLNTNTNSNVPLNTNTNSNVPQKTNINLNVPQKTNTDKITIANIIGLHLIFPQKKASISSTTKGLGIRRESWPLWLLCIAAGCISGPFYAQFLVPALRKNIDFSLSLETAYIILLIIGGISGAVISYFGQESYQKAYSAWPWLLLALLAPLATLLASLALVLVASIVVFVVMIVLYIVGAIVAIIIVCCLCSGG